MPKATPLLPNFNAGELSPRVDGRADVAKYGGGCRKLENMITVVQGPAVRRGGTRFVAEVKDSSKRTWLVRFEYSVTQAYILEFGDKYLRFYTNRAQVVSGMAAYEMATPYAFSDLTNADGTFALRFTQSNDVVYLCHSGGLYPVQKLSRVTNTSWSIVSLAPTWGPFKDVKPDGSSISLSDSSGSVTATCTSPIFTLADVGSPLFLGNPNVGFPPWYAGRTLVAGTIYESDGKYYLCTNSGTAGSVKPTTTEGYQSDGAASFLYLNAGDSYGTITAFISSTQVTLSLVGTTLDVLVSSGTGNYAKAAWNATDGYPVCVAFFKERLCFGRKQRVWTSVAGDYENFRLKDEDGLATTDMAIIRDLQAPASNDLQWMIGKDALLCGTTGAEFAMQPLTTAQAFGPDNCTAPQVSQFGSRAVQAEIIAEAVLFAQRSGKKVRDVVYDYINNRFVSADQNALADHITRTGVTQLSYQQEPFSVLWATRYDGGLAAMTYSREQYETTPYGGWHFHMLGGEFANGNAVVESIASIPSPDVGRDDLWLIVKRTVNGQTKRYIEYLEAEWNDGDDPQDAFYVDCGATLDNTVNAILTPGAGADVAGTTGVPFSASVAKFAASDIGREIHYRYSYLDNDGRTTLWVTSKAKITGYTDSQHVTTTIVVAFPDTSAIPARGWRMTVTTISGLDWLEGQEVSILGDGAVQEEQTVTGGAITLSDKASKVHIGLGSRWRLQTMRLNAGAAGGTPQGQLSQVGPCVVRMQNTLGVEIGRDFDDMQDMDFRNVVDPMDEAIPFYTGDIPTEDFPGDWDRNPWVALQGRQPLPATITAIMPGVQVSA